MCKARLGVLAYPVAPYAADAFVISGKRASLPVPQVGNGCSERDKHIGTNIS